MRCSSEASSSSTCAKSGAKLAMRSISSSSAAPSPAARMSISASHLRALDRAEHRVHVGRDELAAAVRDRLIEQREAVAQRAVGRAREHVDRLVLEHDALGAEDRAHLADDLLGRQALEVELDAAREHRHRQLLRIGRREQELDVRRRLLERLEERVERGLREHVHLVDEVHLVAATRRRVLRVVDQLAHVVDAGVARGVDFEQVDEAARVDLAARAALAARIRGRPVLAVQRLGEDARDRRLADAARAGEQERVMQPAGIERVRERAHDVLLADQLGEAARTPFARKGLIRHGGSLGIDRL